MFIEPSAQAASKGQPPTIRVTTDSLERVHTPDRDDELFELAADRALIVAAGNGYGSVSYESVAEFITSLDGDRIYQYVWMFSAWDRIT